MTSDASSAPFVPHSHLPYGREGSGFYSDNTIGCYDVINMASAAVLEAIDNIDIEGQEPFVMCDFGSADGGTSMSLVTRCIERVKEKFGSDREVVVVYEDQPSNDFQSLIGRIHGLLPGPPTYLSKYADVSVMVSATTFFKPCLAKGWLHLGISATAMHWLSTRPCPLTGAIHHTSAIADSERQKFRNQAARDWEAILLARAHELAPGGRLVIACFCIDEMGQYLGNTRRIKNSMFDRMTSLWSQMEEEGRITKEEFRQTTFNNYYRTVDEFVAPFSDIESSVYKSGLRLVSIETKVVPCPYHKRWMQERAPGTNAAAARAHAQWYVPTTRTWSNSVFRSALSDFRSDQEKDAIVNEFFKRYENEVAGAPGDHGMDYVHAYVHILKAN